ncbi:MAG: MATE family efflux transporter [Oscillospiraceae bacterium]|nr:MATE family efflux transporter [Oscillospiraceae bacterium]
MTTEKNDFSKGSIPRAIMRMAIPITVAQMVNVAYNLVDRMFIGHLEGVGTDALTGLGICMPVIFIITAFANLCGMGGSPLCSIARGEGDIRRAEKLQANSLTLLLIFAVSLTVLLHTFMKPLLFAFGASEDTYAFAADYMRVYLFGTVFSMLSLGMNPFINSQGFGKMGMLTTVIGAAVNLALDPLFIYVFDLGIKGAAYATVIAQFCSAAWVMLFLCSKKAALRMKAGDMRLEGKLVSEILAMGVVGFCMSITNGIVQAVANVQLRTYGGDLYVGVMTVVNSLQQVLFLAVSGVSNGASPVMGYNYGAKEYERVRKSIRFITWLSMWFIAVVTAVILWLPAPLIRIFNNDPALVEAAVPAARIFFACYIFMGFQMVGQRTFQSLGRAKKAVFFSLLRKVIIVVPLTLLLPALGLGVMGVFWAELVSNVVGGTACYATMYFTEYRVLGKEISV